MKTIIENWKIFLKEQNIAYSGVLLDDSSREKLLSLEIPDGWEKIAHHMTITMGPIVHPKGKHDFSSDYAVGSPVNLEVIAIGMSDKALAVKVRPPADISPKVKFPHVTIAVNREAGGKPFDSNKIPEENFKPLSGITLTGKVAEIPQK